MTLILHENCKNRLTQALTSILSQIRVEHGKFVVRHQALSALEVAERILPIKGELRTRLGQYVDHDRPLTEFILDTLSDELSELPFTDVESQLLIEIAGYGDCHAVAKRLVECLINLPSKYTLSFPLLPELSNILGGDFKLELSPRVRIVRAGENLSALYPPIKTDGLGPGVLSMGLLGAWGTGWLSSVNWTKDGVYLQVDADGYIGPYGGTNPYLEAVRALRAFSGLGLALGLLDIGSTYLSQSPPSDVLIHRQEPDGVFVPIRAISLDDGISRTVKRLALSKFVVSFDSEMKIWSKPHSDMGNNLSEIPCRVSSDLHEWRNDFPTVSTTDPAKLKYE